jgi:hypothetical protein
MDFSLTYTIFFWVTWVIVIPVILKVVPAGTELIYMVVYSIIGAALYFLIPNLVTARLEDQQETKYQNRNLKTEAKKKFLDEQRLIKQRRYIKSDKKENTITTPKTALQIIEEYKKKKSAV